MPQIHEFYRHYRTGTLYAAAWFIFLRLNGRERLSLGQIAEDMPREHDDFAVGFMDHVQSYLSSALESRTAEGIKREAGEGWPPQFGLTRYASLGTTEVAH